MTRHPHRGTDRSSQGLGFFPVKHTLDYTVLHYLTNFGKQNISDLSEHKPLF